MLISLPSCWKNPRKPPFSENSRSNTFLSVQHWSRSRAWVKFLIPSFCFPSLCFFLLSLSFLAYFFIPFLFLVSVFREYRLCISRQPNYNCTISISVQFLYTLCSVVLMCNLQCISIVLLRFMPSCFFFFYGTVPVTNFATSYSIVLSRPIFCHFGLNFVLPSHFHSVYYCILQVYFCVHLCRISLLIFCLPLICFHFLCCIRSCLIVH